MKTLNNIIFISLAFMVLGSFANFARNDYGYQMILWMQLIIAIIFFTQAFISFNSVSESGWGKAFYLFAESMLIGAIFLGAIFKSMHWAGASFLYAAGSSLLTLQYFIYAIACLVKGLKKGAFLSFMVFLFLITSVLAVEGLIFKILHFPYSRILGNIVVVLFVFILLIGIMKRKFSYEGGKISLYNRLMQLTGRPVFVFNYFSIWVIYITLIVYGLAPDFYSNAKSRPTVAEELKQKGEDDKASEYMDNYETFFQNRWDEQQH